MSGDALFGGIDVGTWSTKMAIIDGDGRLLGSSVVRSNPDLAATATKCMHEAVACTGIARGVVSRVVACGYGRDVVSFADDRRTEITCHGVGARTIAGMAGKEFTVVDIGGQDTKVIRMAADGRVKGFKMNRKCAAGTGAFLEEAALKLGVPLEELDGMAAGSGDGTGAGQVAELGSYCTVFTATEMLKRIREGATRGSLAAGLFDSVARRVTEMGPFLGSVIVLTGGVAAHNPYMAIRVRARVDKGTEVIVPEHAQLMGAIGASLFAAGKVGGSGGK